MSLARKAIADYTKAIELTPSYAEEYHGRGGSKYFSGDRSGGCADVRKAESLGYELSSRFLRERCQ